MLTITIDDELVSQTRKVGSHKNDMEAVIAALQEYIAKHEKLPSVDLSLQDWVSELYGAKSLKMSWRHRLQRGGKRLTRHDCLRCLCAFSLPI